MRRLFALLAAAALVAGHAAPAQAQPRPKAAPKAPAKAPARGKAPQPPRGAKAQPGQPGQPTDAARRAVAGSAADEAAAPTESPELVALREAERELFPRGAVAASPLLEGPPAFGPPGPRVNASGLPPAAASLNPAEAAPREVKLAWLQNLKQPDLPVRWDERVVRYLQFFRDDPRGRSMVALGWRRAGRYRDVIRAALRAEKLPESLLWVAMVESSFDARIRSHAGAAGLWQLMPEGGRLYGLRVDRWMDERQDPVRSSLAAARYLADLHRRFGGWELALAAYNMGFGGLLSAIRKYNTNDFWELSRFEAGVPWETALYVPKILALAVVAENPQAFGLDSVTPEPALAFDTVRAPATLSLDAVARAAGSSPADLASLNPHLLARRAPPSPLGDYDIRVPAGQGTDARKNLAAEAAREPRLVGHTVRFGQTLDALAQELGTSRSRLASLNGLGPVDAPRPGDLLLIPDGLRSPAPGAERPVVVAPRSPASLPGRRRVFYRVIGGDSLAAIAAAFHVGADDLKSWNVLDPQARLQEGTTLQIFVEPSQDLSGVVAVRAEDARVLVVGTDEFFAWFEAQKGRRRVSITVGQGETWKTLSGKYGLSVGLLERINRRSRSEPLRPGESLIVYTRKAGPADKNDPEEQS